MATEEKPRVLCVDDEPAVLDGLRRVLRRDFEIETAPDGRTGIEMITGPRPYAVVISDLHMPEMDGAVFLFACRKRAPATTRMLLSGGADVSDAMAAVNQGGIFRLLLKPCDAETLRGAVHLAAEQHRLLTAERVLLEETLRGSVKMLTSALALASPEAFGTAAAVQRRAGDLADVLGAPSRWIVELAGMLSEVARISLPPATQEKYLTGQPLDAMEQSMIERLPSVARELISDIPRLDEVRTVLEDLDRDYSAAEPDAIALGARILRASRDLELRMALGATQAQAEATLARRSEVYDPAVLAALSQTAQHFEENDVELDEIVPGMVLVDPVRDLDGRLLVGPGQDVSAGMIRRLQNFAARVGVRSPIRVKQPVGPPRPRSLDGALPDGLVRDAFDLDATG